MEYFFTIVGFRGYATGPRYMIGQFASEREIIEVAQGEGARLDDSERDGIEAPIAKGRLAYAVPFVPGDELAAAINKLNEGDKIFEAYPINHNGMEQFVARAKALGMMADAARVIVAAARANWAAPAGPRKLLYECTKSGASCYSGNRS